MKNKIFKAFHKLRTLIRKSIADGEADSEEFIDAIRDWHKELGEIIKKPKKKK